LSNDKIKKLKDKKIVIKRIRTLFEKKIKLTNELKKKRERIKVKMKFFKGYLIIIV